jgi:hypothetical protein
MRHCFTDLRREVLILLVLKAKERLEDLHRLLVDLVLRMVLQALDLIQPLRLIDVVRVRVGRIRPAQLLVRLALSAQTSRGTPHVKLGVTGSGLPRG